MLQGLKSFFDISPDYPNPLRSIINQGFANYMDLRAKRRSPSFLTENSRILLHSKHARHPLICRGHTTDVKVFSQIFLFREYRCLDHVENPGLIIDCGANVGYSSAYFLSRYPAAELIAVEPDPNNFNLMVENLRPFGERVRCINSAIWSHSSRLKMSEMMYRDGGAWAQQVRECTAEENGGFLATDIGTLLKESNHKRISILKIDIEGAEGVVFSKNFEAWIDRVDVIAIELHADTYFGDNSTIFAQAIKGRGFRISRSEELTICKHESLFAKTLHA